MFKSLRGLTALLLLAGSISVNAQQYALIQLPAPSDYAVPPQGFAINASGQVTGQFYPFGFTIQPHLFLYAGGVTTDLGYASPICSNSGLNGTGINASGEMAVTVCAPQELPTPGFYQNGSIRLVNLGSIKVTDGVFGGFSSAINTGGVITGTLQVPVKGSCDGNGYEPFIYDTVSGAVQSLGSLFPCASTAYAINDAGQIAGTFDDLTGAPHAFIYGNGTVLDLGGLGGQYATATGINATGQATGYSTTGETGFFHAFLYTNGAMQDIGNLGGTSNSKGLSINAAAQIVGFSWTKNNVAQHAFLYSNGSMVDLNAQLSSGDAALYTLTTAVAINDAGQIVAQGYVNSNSSQTVTFLLTPQIPPSITSTIVGTRGSNGWYTSNVMVTWTVSDALGITSQSGCGPTTISTDTAGQVVTCSATSVGGSGSASVTIKRDATPPVVSAAGSPLPNSAGWNNSAVTVAFVGADSTSGIANCSAPVIVSTQGANQTSPAGTCTDNAGNVAVPVAANGISIDESAPGISDVISSSGPESPTGWYTTPVTVNFTGMDPLSGIAPGGCSGTVTLSSSGAAQTATGTCTNLAGDVATLTASGINIDLTIPAAAFTASPPPNANGWNNTPVTITFSGTDSLNGSGIASCTAPITLSTAGAGQLATGTCKSVAGTGSAPVTDTVNINLTPPTIVLVSPPNNSAYPIGANLVAAYSCTDALSGDPTATCIGSVANGSPIDTGTAGAKNLSVTGTDVAGNSATSSVNYLISALTLATPGSIWTFAGNGVGAFNGDGGPAQNASIRGPNGVAADSVGNVYIADYNNERIRKVAADGTITTVAGNGTFGYAGDGGPATAAELFSPSGIAVDAAGNLYIADSNNQRVRRVGTDGTITTVAGNGTFAYSGDGGPATAAGLHNPNGVAVDTAGNLYIADELNQRVRLVAPDGTISTVAGNGTQGFAGDAGPATTAQLNNPTSVAVDAVGNLYIADASNQRIREVAPNGIISTIAGNGTAAYSGDGGAAIDASLNGPYSITVDPARNVYVADVENNVVRKINASGLISTIAGFGQPGFSGDGGIATNATLQSPLGVTLDSAGNLYISDNNNQRIRLVPRIGGTDSTPPVVAPSIAGTSGAGGWYTSNVTVTWTVTDPLGPIISQAGCGATTVNADTTGQMVTCTAVGNGGTTTQSVTIKRDATPPVATATPSPLPNGNGWNNSAVTVRFNGTDSTSGIASCSAPIIVVTQGSNQSSAAGTCTDQAGNVSAPIAAGHINIDESPPTLSDVITDSVPLSPTGWYTAPVTVNFSGSDPLSGVAPGACSGSVTLASSGAGQTAMGACINLAGNTGTLTVSGINVDLTTPVASYSAVPPPNANGWNNTPVTVTFFGTDSISGSGIASCTAPVTLATSGAGQIASGSCSSIAGTASAPVTDAVNINLTPPTIAIGNPASGSGFPVGSKVNAVYTCTDALSQVAAATCIGTIASGAALDTSAAGTKSFSVASTDLAGNTMAANSSYQISSLTFATPGSIWTFAGNGTAASYGDGGLAINAALSNPTGVVADTLGNVFVADNNNSRVRKIATDGTISTVAGIGVSGFGGDGGLAVNAQLSYPAALALDGAGNLYIADVGNARVRKLATDGTISTVVGNGEGGVGGDGGPATNAGLYDPFGLAVDAAGNLYIADYGSNRIRKVDTHGLISTVAGTGNPGYSGDGGLATNANLWLPAGVAVDATGNLYIADYGNNRIRKVATDGSISTLAGTGAPGYSGDGGPATNAMIYAPWGITVGGDGSVYFSDTANSVVRKISSNGLISTVAGTLGAGFNGDGGMAIAASMNYPTGVACDGSGNLYVADGPNNRVRLVPGGGSSDTTPPVLAPTVTGTLGNNGWYTSNVSVTWTVSDPLAPIISQTGCGTTTISTDTAGQLITCTAVGQGGTSTQFVTIKRDATAPAVSATPSPLPNTNGWNNSTVTVAFSGSDSTSGIASCSVPVSVVTEGANQTSPSGTCTDNAGNASTPVAATDINIDKTGPVVTGKGAPGPNGSGWNNTPVTVTFTAMDVLSGVAANGCPAPVVFSSNGAGQSVQGSCTDKAGNSASAIVSNLNIDTVAPVVTATANPAPNGAGWNDSPVTVSFSGTDNLDGSGVASCSPNVVLSASGANQVASGNCTDKAGNVSALASKTINLDQSLPFVGVSVPVSGASYAVGSTVDAVYSCSDASSGLTSCAGTVANGAPINTFAPGTYGFSVVATSVAGTTATMNLSYKVVAAAPAYTLSPNPLAFGAQAPTTSTTQVITLASTGTTALSVTAITVTGGNTGQFSQTNTCGTSVPAGATCAISVTFSPTSVGAKTSSVKVTTTGGAGTQSATLSGTGAVSTYTLTPATLGFGNVQTNVANTQIVAIANTGSVALPIKAVSIGGANPGQFSVINSVPAGDILCPMSGGFLPPAGAPGSTCEFLVQFLPTSTGAKTATLKVTPGGGVAADSSTLSGTGVVPTYSLTAAALTFGNQARGTVSTPQAITLTNTGSLLLPNPSIAVTGMFSETDNCGTTVAIGGSCTIEVTFAPTSKGAKHGMLTVNAGAGAAKETATLAGMGT